MQTLIVIAAVVIAGATVATAQERPRYSPPRTASGQPDFQGVWTMRTLTPFERPTGVEALSVSADQEASIIALIIQERILSERYDPGTDAPDGSRLAVVRGERRTSQIIDPSDGRIALTDAGRRRLKERPDGADGPEARPSNERCIADAGRAPYRVMSGEMYFQIIQTADYLVLNKEGMDPPRIFFLGADRLSPKFPAWPGNSTARWDGAVLTIRTTNFRPDDVNRRISGPGAAGIPITPNTRITEWLERISDDELLYRYKVEDESLFVRPVTAELPLMRTQARMFESACHEGNSGFVNILRGARQEERRRQEDHKQP